MWVRAFDGQLVMLGGRLPRVFVQERQEMGHQVRQLVAASADEQQTAVLWQGREEGVRAAHRLVQAGLRMRDHWLDLPEKMLGASAEDAPA